MSVPAVQAPAVTGDDWVVLQHPNKKLCKIIGPDEVQPYQLGKHFRVQTVHVENLAGFHSLLVRLSADDSRCLLRGRFVGGFLADKLGVFPAKPDQYPRTRVLFPDCAQHVVMFDVDKFIPNTTDDPTSVQAVLEFRSTLPAVFHDAAMVFYFSASAGFSSSLKCRVAFWLKNAVTTEQLAVWSRNIENIDRVLYRPVQIHYTAAPVFVDGAIDPFEGRERVGYVDGGEVDLHIDPLLVLLERPQRPRVIPINKAGVVGAFCRAYSISDVLDRWLPHVFEYESESTNRRLTFLLSSSRSPGGAFITDGGDAICNMHDSDPFDGQPANAWDLVREYHFGHLDDDAARKLDVWKRPSQKAMEDFAAHDSRVVTEQVRQGMESARAAFENIENEDFSDQNNPPPHPAAGASLLTDHSESNPSQRESFSSERRKSERPLTDTAGTDAATGNAPSEIALISNENTLATIAELRASIGRTPSVSDLQRILLGDPNIARRLRYNALTDEIDAAPGLPWRHGRAGPLSDADAMGFCVYLCDVYGLKKVSKSTVWDILTRLQDLNSTQPMREYIDAQTWDGIARLDDFLIRHMGAEDSAYTRAVTRKTICAVVARQYRPGEKFDSVLTLIGEQGIGKSSIFRELLPQGQWFAEHPPSLSGGKDFFEWAHGNVICELSELSGMSNADIEHVKSLISTRSDRYRAAYGRAVIARPRQFVLIASSNQDRVLRDDTGNRRWWPVRCSAPPDPRKTLAAVRRESGQIWAEAAHYWRLGERLYLEMGTVEFAQSLAVQRSCLDDDAGGTESLSAWLDMPIGENGERRTTVCGRTIFVEYMRAELRDYNQMQSRRIARMMQGAENWRPVPKVTGRYGRQRGWVRVV